MANLFAAQFPQNVNTTLIYDTFKEYYRPFTDKDFDLTVLQRSCAVIKKLRFVISEKLLISLEILLNSENVFILGIF